MHGKRSSFHQTVQWDGDRQRLFTEAPSNPVKFIVLILLWATRNFISEDTRANRHTAQNMHEEILVWCKFISVRYFFPFHSQFLKRLYTKGSSLYLRSIDVKITLPIHSFSIRGNMQTHYWAEEETKHYSVETMFASFMVR